MLSLSHFPPPPSDDKVTACENDGQLRAFGSLEAKQKIHEWLGNYNVEVYIGQENVRSAYSKYEAKEAFSAHAETIWQRLVAAYYEEGFVRALRQVSLEEGAASALVRRGATLLLKVVEALERAKALLPSPSRASSLPKGGESPPTLQVSGGSVLRIAWHPHTSTVAALYGDDSVRVFGKGRTLTPLLKHRWQKGVTHMQWMPCCASVLGVGCASGLLLWTLDPISVVTRPSGSCLVALAHPGATPLTAFAWHPQGLRLACVGGKGRELVVWDSSSEEAATVHSGPATCVASLAWSPDGARLAALMANAAIKVFETRSWTFERWSVRSRVRTCVWSSCGRVLLFATVREPVLFCLSFKDGDGGVGGAQVATQVADLSPVLATCLEDGMEERVGGLVSELAWDRKGERLAVLFGASPFVALFHTYAHPALHLAPGGFIRGEKGQTPLHISFQSNVSNGAILTTVWSSGEVKHLPLRYTSHDVRPHSSGGGPPEGGRFSSSSTFPQMSRSIFASPPPPSHPHSHLNQSRLLNVSLGPTSPLAGSPLPRLFTSPS